MPPWMTWAPRNLTERLGSSVLLATISGQAAVTLVGIPANANTPLARTIDAYTYHAGRFAD